MQRRADQAAGLPQRRVEALTARRDRTGVRNPPVAVLADHGDDAVDQVAQAVGEFVVGPRDQPRHGEIGVAHPRHLAEQPPAHRVSTVLGGQRGRLQRARRPGGTGGLADLPAPRGQVVMHEDAGRQRLTRRQQHGGPVDGVEPDTPLPSR